MKLIVILHGSTEYPEGVLGFYSGF